MGTLTFPDKKRFIPLQAADFIAYEAYKHLDNQLRQSGRGIRGPLRVLIEGGYQIDARHFEYERLKELVEYYERTKGQQGKEPWWPWHRLEDTERH